MAPQQAHSWWVGLSREELWREAMVRALAMSASREGRQIDGTRGIVELASASVTRVRRRPLELS